MQKLDVIDVLETAQRLSSNIMCNSHAQTPRMMSARGEELAGRVWEGLKGRDFEGYEFDTHVGVILEEGKSVFEAEGFAGDTADYYR